MKFRIENHLIVTCVIFRFVAIRQEHVFEVPPEEVCALPVCYRTTDEYPTFF